MNLKIQNVSLSIRGRFIVKNVSVTVNPGEVVGLMGPNGAGKTTTFNLAVGNIKPDKGEVLMNGKNITKLPLPIRSRLGLLKKFGILLMVMKDKLFKEFYKYLSLSFT